MQTASMPADILLTNWACEVRARGSVLELDCPTTLLDAWFLLAGHAAIPLALVTGTLALASVIEPAWIGGSLLLLAFGLVAARWARARHDSRGRFAIDSQALTVTRVGTSEVVPFDRIVVAEPVRDWTDASRIDLWPVSPSWLRLRLADGTFLTVAKGSRAELQRVAVHLARFGVRVAPELLP